MSPQTSSRAPAGAAVAALWSALAIGLGTAAAEAGAPPELTIDWLVDTSFVNHLTPIGTDVGDGLFNYVGSDIHDATGVTLDFDVDGSSAGRLGGDLVITNPSLSTVQMSVLLTLPIDAIADTLLRGSADIELTTDEDGGAMETFAGAPVWLSLIDGIPEVSAILFPDPFTINVTGAGSDGASSSFGMQGGLAGPSASATMGILIQFTLTPGDRVSITGVLFIIPGPGGIALLLAGGCLSGRRRRG